VKEFLFVAKDDQAKTRTGEMFAWDLKHATRMLHDRGFTIISINPVKRRNILFFLMEGSRGRTIALFVRQLAALLRAGIPLMKALDSISDVPERYMKKIMSLIKLHVTSGYSLSEALKIHSDIFPSHLIATIRVGEISGTLPDNLENLAEYIEKDHALRLRIRAAMTYPTVICAVCFFMIFFIFAFILPQFQGFFTEVDMEFPPITQFLMNFVIVMRTQYVMLALAFLIIFTTLYFAFRFVRSDSRMREKFDGQVLRIPVWGLLKRKFFYTWFFRSVGSMLASGAALSQCLQILGNAEGNGVFSKAILDTRKLLVSGWTMSRSLNKTGEFPRMVSNMVMVGEESGKLDIMFLKLADYYQAEVEYAIANLSRLVEPALLIILGAGVAFILLGAFMPIYQLAGVSSGGMRVAQTQYAAGRGSPTSVSVMTGSQGPRRLSIKVRGGFSPGDAEPPPRSSEVKRVKVGPPRKSKTVAAAKPKGKTASFFGKVRFFTPGEKVVLTGESGGKGLTAVIGKSGEFTFGKLRIREKYTLFYESTKFRLAWRLAVEIPAEGEYEAILDESNAQEPTPAAASARAGATLAGRAEIFSPGEKVTITDSEGRTAVSTLGKEGTFSFTNLRGKTKYVISYDHGDFLWRLSMELPGDGDYEAVLTESNGTRKPRPSPAEHPLRNFDKPGDGGGQSPPRGPHPLRKL
jgi:type IV pilus assembly protein PilC